jgi:hypothetical protein
MPGCLSSDALLARKVETQSMPYAAAELGEQVEIWNTGIVIVVALLMRRLLL